MDDNKKCIPFSFIMFLIIVFSLAFVRTNAKADYIEDMTVGYTETGSEESPVEVYIDGYTLAAGEKLYALTWSEENGQDDLISYEMSEASDKRFIADIALKRHNSFGRYFTHFYSNLNGEMRFVAATEYLINEPQSNEIRINSIYGDNGTYRINISGLTNQTDIKEIKVAVWSNTDQSDLIWYTAKRDVNGDCYAEIRMSDYGYKDAAFNEHVYMWDVNGNATFLGADSVEYHKENNSISIDFRDNKYVITLKATGIISGRCALWSEENGQDDLAWHEMEYDSSIGALTLSVSPDVLRHTGKAYAHVYTDIGSKSEFVNGLEFNTEQIREKLYIETDRNAGSFRLVVNKNAVSPDFDSVVIPVWSKADQSDIVWYQADKDETGNYSVESNISRHGGNLAEYYAHAYGCTSNGSKIFIDGKLMNFNASCDSIKCEKKDNKNYIISVVNPGVPGGISKIEAAVWSDNNGQDDLAWTEGSRVNDHEYQISVDIGKHKDNGSYSLHIYATTNNGNKVFIGAYADIFVYSNISGNISFKNIDNQNGTFEAYIKLSNTSNYLKKIVVPVWTSDDQNDIKWYTAEKISADTYKVVIDVKNHKYNYGNYHIHVYAGFGTDELDFVTGTDKYFSRNATITVSDSDGTYKRRLTYYGKGLSSVRFAVWSDENGQDDFRWYDGIKQGDEFYVDVPLSNHSHNGSYSVHLYTGDDFICATQFSLINYVEWAVKTANDNRVGYSQEHRDLNPDVDCSSFIYYSLYYSGFAGNLSSVAFYTGTELYYLQRCGFKTYKYTSESNLKPGDILWYRRNGGGHTEIYMGNHMLVGARNSVVDGIDYPQGGDQTGKEVAVGGFYNPGWMYVMRYYE